MRIDIMTDIETLGTKPNSTVFQVSAIAFNIFTGEILDKFDEIIDISKEDIIADGNTVKWWLETNKELMASLLLNETAKPSNIVFDMFKQWIVTQTEDYKEIYLWGNGIKFDNVMIDAQMSKHNINYPIFYKNDRDVRTILELASLKSGYTEKEIKESVEDSNEVEHNALDDCRFQIRIVCKCFDILIR